MKSKSQLVLFVKSINEDNVKRCCPNEPSYEIEYTLRKIYKVCKNCFKKSHWNQHIKEKKTIDPKGPIETHQLQTTKNEVDTIE